MPRALRNRAGPNSQLRIAFNHDWPQRRTAILPRLHGRTGHRTERTEHAAITGVRSQAHVTRRALMKEETRIGGHLEAFDMSACGTCQVGEELHASILTRLWRSLPEHCRFAPLAMKPGCPLSTRACPCRLQSRQANPRP
jgi:hypothetical protein